ncbi:hypothetical protein CK203_023424 [Vitis vinifera]|uniref:Reverse transcriptase Ty1/copia-type domain-containing protein n=1 Tax=Vitis vinifera TaxID=29760 RepID=A0A438J6L8_VITVI|nr:hypothetical protein CK203_023424 [Vitis vinifera]
MQIHAPFPSPLALITHPMKTRSKNNIFKPSPNYALLNTPSPNLPIESTSVTQALKSPKWHKAMSEEFTTLIKNGCNPATVQRVVTQLRSKFSIKDLGTLSYFLGIKVLPTPVGAFFSQHKYIQYLLTIAKIDNADDMSTPMSPSA